MADPPKRPGSILVRGEVYVAKVFRVTSIDEQGRPKTCEIYYDNAIIDVRSGGQFLVVYVNSRGIAPKAVA